MISKIFCKFVRVEPTATRLFTTMILMIVKNASPKSNLKSNECRKNSNGNRRNDLNGELGDSTRSLTTESNNLFICGF